MADERVYVPFRIGPSGKKWLDELAEKHTRRADRSKVIRAALAVARNHQSEVVARLKEDS